MVFERGGGGREGQCVCLCVSIPAVWAKKFFFFSFSLLGERKDTYDVGGGASGQAHSSR